MKRYDLRELAAGKANLAGATSATRQLRSIAADFVEGEDVVFDARHIESATSSYFKALLFPFHALPKVAEAPDLPEAFPFVLGPCPEVREELLELAASSNRPILEATVLAPGEAAVHRARVIGSLDEKLDETFRALRVRREATATDLYTEAAAAGSKVNITAFNNRLAELHARRLVRRRRSGKQWLYQPVAEEFEDG